MKKTINLMKYHVETTKEDGTVKTSHTNNFEQASRMYDKFKAFAKKHNLTWTVSLYGEGFLLESETINPTRVLAM